MRRTRTRRSARLAGAAALAAAALVLLLPSSALGVARIFAVTAGKPDLDTRAGTIQPSAAQLGQVKALGAHATWNRFGTPASLIRYGGYLAEGLGSDPVDAAKAFLDKNKALFKLQSVGDLELVNDAPLVGTDAHAVLFTQRFGNLLSAQDGMVAVGVAGGKVAYASAATAPGSLTGAARISAFDAWATAARSVGVKTGAVKNVTTKNGWTQFDVGGLNVRKGAFGRGSDLPPIPPIPPIPTPPPTPPSTPPVPSVPGGPSAPTVPVTPPTPGVPSAGDLAQRLADLIRMLLGKLPTAPGAAGPNGPANGPSALNVDVPSVHQQARLVAFPTVKQGVRPAWEVDVISSRPGNLVGYQFMVDAESGKILWRRNAVQQVAAQSLPQPYVFQGTTGATECGQKHAFAVGAGQRSIAAVGSYVLPTNDAVLKLYDPSGQVVAAQDTGTSPEPIYYQPQGSGPLTQGLWSVQMCPFGPSSIAPQIGPYIYAIVVAVLPIQLLAELPLLPRPIPPTAVTNNPRWKYFGSFPKVDYASQDVRTQGCWTSSDDGIANEPCAEILKNPYSPFGWDIYPRVNQSLLTTRGNNAFTAEAWISPLTPAESYSPVSLDRRYNFSWKNQWYASKCNPSALASVGDADLGKPAVGGRNDIDAATTNLFVLHNRMHDFSYALGFTEQNYNLQWDNLDKGVRPVGPYPFGREDDPELGDAQAGAATGGQPSFEGRDNANQITLNDGVPPITNQYLWQPIAGAFYSPCVDGAFDLSVAGHEYTHAISNRMVGGPDAGLTGAQAGSMGESWSDLDALEFLHEYGLAGARGESPWSLGAYVTGNRERGIRDYALDDNPLNFSDVGFDTTGPEVHADGEIWNGVNYSVRSELVKKYGAGDAAANLACAKGERPATQCPGGRRWIQLIYDAWLLMQPSVSMVDARDAMLAADVLRFGGANQAELWRGFARTGLGATAQTEGTDDTQPTPSFESPLERNATVTFSAVPLEGKKAVKVKAKVYVGDYEARVTPVADTDPGTPLGNKAGFVPGTYSFVVQAPGYGLVEFQRTLKAGSSSLTVSMPTNWASRSSGASATGDGVNLDKLIDDTEATNWYSGGKGVKGQQVTVTLKGRHLVSAVRVSAMLRPADSNDDADSSSQSRFTALRSFQIDTCDASVENCTQADSWQTVFTSPKNAFPAAAPRPVAPDLTLRTFDVPDTQATKVRIVMLSSQCTGGPDFAGEQDNDPTNDTDCTTASGLDQDVRTAELEVVSRSPVIK